MCTPHAGSLRLCHAKVLSKDQKHRGGLQAGAGGLRAGKACQCTALSQPCWLLRSAETGCQPICCVTVCHGALQEILRFAGPIVLSPEENKRRSAAHGLMQAACAAAQLPTVRPFGSRASGLELWDSDIDLVVLGVVDPTGDNHSKPG